MMMAGWGYYYIRITPARVRACVAQGGKKLKTKSRE